VRISTERLRFGFLAGGSAGETNLGVAAASPVVSGSGFDNCSFELVGLLRTAGSSSSE